MTTTTNRSAASAARQPPSRARVSIYRGRRFGWRAGWTLLAPGLLLVVALPGYAYWQYYYAYAHYGPVAASAWSRPWYWILPAGVGAFLLLLLWRLFNAHQRLELHSDGLLHRRFPMPTRRLAFSELQGLSIDQSQEYFLQRTSHPRQRLVLYPQAGRPWHLDESLENLPDLAERIKAILYPRLEPVLAQRFAAGETLPFGPLSIQRQGLSIGRRALTWDQIERLAVQGGRLVITLTPGTQSGGQTSLSVPVARIPNFELLLRILEHSVTT